MLLVRERAIKHATKSPIPLKAVTPPTCRHSKNSHRFHSLAFNKASAHVRSNYIHANIYLALIAVLTSDNPLERLLAIPLINEPDQCPRNQL